jgi:hypothetical protein
MFHRKINYRWTAGKKTVTSCVNIRIKIRSKSNETINNLQNWINISLIINFWLKLVSFQICKSLNFQNKKFNWPVMSRFFTRHKRKKNFFWSVVSSVKVSVNPICTNLIGYHSATECRSYDRPKIHQNADFINAGFWRILGQS